MFAMKIRLVEFVNLQEEINAKQFLVSHRNDALEA